MSKSTDNVDSMALSSSSSSSISGNYWNDIKTLIYSSSSQDQLPFDKFKELLVKIELNESNMFKFEEAFETFYTSLVAYCSYRICSDIDSCKYPSVRLSSFNSFTLSLL